jgi:SPP1 family predicted phage head-tail adaptor
MKCCDLYAGKLRTPVTFERLTITGDDGMGGGSAEEWNPVHNARAYVLWMSATERYRADRLEASLNGRIYIRYTSKIKSSDRVIVGGREMQIRGEPVNLEERNQWLEVYAESGVVT